MYAHPRRTLAAAVTVAALAWLPACDEGPEDPAHDFFVKEVEPILVDNCVAGCHGPDGVYPAIDLREGEGEQALLDGNSSQAAGMPFVEPGDPDGSYLWHKLADTQAEVGGSGELMPKDAEPLAESELDSVREWIELL